MNGSVENVVIVARADCAAMVDINCSTIERILIGGEIRSLRVFVVCPENDRDVFASLNRDLEIIIDPRLASNSLIDNFERSSRPGWNFQQYLKFKAVEFIGERALIIDGDTALSSSFMTSLLKTNALVTSKEKVDQYTSVIKALGFNCDFGGSFIANCGVFNMEALSLSGGVDDLFLHVLKLESADRPFSEYQLMGESRFYRGDYSSILRPRFFRRADLIRKPAHSLLGPYDIVATELFHERSTYKKIAATLFETLKMGW